VLARAISTDNLKMLLLAMLVDSAILPMTQSHKIALRAYTPIYCSNNIYAPIPDTF